MISTSRPCRVVNTEEEHGSESSSRSHTTLQKIHPADKYVSKVYQEHHKRILDCNKCNRGIATRRAPQAASLISKSLNIHSRRSSLSVSLSLSLNQKNSLIIHWHINPPKNMKKCTLQILLYNSFFQIGWVNRI